jgi:hypothetical protein
VLSYDRIHRNVAYSVCNEGMGRAGALEVTWAMGDGFVLMVECSEFCEADVIEVKVIEMNLCGYFNLV